MSEEEKLSTFHDCPEREQRIARVICDRNLMSGKCHKVEKIDPETKEKYPSCEYVKKMDITDDERTRRSERMKKVHAANKAAREAGKVKDEN
jgi:hypothetical protein